MRPQEDIQETEQEIKNKIENAFLETKGEIYTHICSNCGALDSFPDYNDIKSLGKWVIASLAIICLFIIPPLGIFLCFLSFQIFFGNHKNQKNLVCKNCHATNTEFILKSSKGKSTYRKFLKIKEKQDRYL